ncbi:hypothetical protein [Alicyclobacillus acidiphilus]|uniref:hypothetical protein n=1 Tax=Alicyclobacillus acidiphilus TaxID=182455 RepID=UPI000830F8B3|nr:hypothetical protein [Alicyclobacillus acidiphilus]
MKAMRRAIGLLLLGVLIGAAMATAYSSRDLNRLHIALRQLQQANDQLENENQFLVAEQSNPSNHILRSIKVDCPQGTSVMLQTAIKKQVLQSLSFLQGKSNQILLQNPYIPSAIVDVQTIVLEKRRYRLHVSVVIMTDDTLYLNVSGQPEPAS